LIKDMNGKIKIKLCDTRSGVVEPITGGLNRWFEPNDYCEWGPCEDTVTSGDSVLELFVG